MKKVKIKIDESNKHVYIDALEEMRIKIASKPSHTIVDYLIIKFNQDLLHRVYCIKEKKTITLNQYEQLIVMISFAFVPDMTSRMILFEIGKGLNADLTRFINQYVSVLEK